MSLLVAVLMSALACAPALVIHRRLPPAHDVGDQRRAAVLIASGPGDRSTPALIHAVAGLVTGESQDPLAAVAELQARLPEALQHTGYFELAPAEAADLVFELTVTQWWTQVWDADALHDSRYVKASLASRLRVLRRSSGEVVATTDYAVTTKLPLGEDGHAGDAAPELVADAVDQTIRSIIYDFAPTRDDRRIPLDEAVEVRSAIALIEQGALPDAREELERVLRSSPTSAAAHYNLGVLDEAKSDFPSAERRYARAEELRSRQLYRDGLRRVKGLRQVQ
jgi:tetratricopeptide (TPR) repeat protein